jgi:hypothetical protein
LADLFENTVLLPFWLVNDLLEFWNDHDRLHEGSFALNTLPSPWHPSARLHQQAIHCKKQRPPFKDGLLMTSNIYIFRWLFGIPLFL